MKTYERTIYLWKRIDPSKKFSRFTFEDVNTFKDLHTGYCIKNEIVRIDGHFYIYSGAVAKYSTEKIKSVIRFKNRSKIIANITVTI